MKGSVRGVRRGEGRPPDRLEIQPTRQHELRIAAERMGRQEVGDLVLCLVHDPFVDVARGLVEGASKIYTDDLRPIMIARRCHKTVEKMTPRLAEKSIRALQLVAGNRIGLQKL